MELCDFRVFLTLVDELHFARTADRLGLSTGRVSQLISRLEGELGGSLFARTSRRVQVTALGRQLEQRVRPALAELDDAVAEARRAAGAEPLRVRVAGSITTIGNAWTQLRRAAEQLRPELEVVLVELPFGLDPYRLLRDGTADALLYWNHLLPPGLRAGPVIDRQQRVAMVGANHALAGETSILISQIDRWHSGAGYAPQAVLDALLPPSSLDADTTELVDVLPAFLPNAIDLIREGDLAHATAASITTVVNHADIVLVPIRDLPPLESF